MLKYSLIVLGAQQRPVNYTGALVLLSSDVFDKTGMLLDLLRAPNGIKSPSVKSLCQKDTWAQCEDLIILDAAFVRPYIVFLTSHGFFHSADFTTQTENTFTRLNPTIVNGTSTTLDYSGKVALHSSNDCLLGALGYVYFTHSQHRGQWNQLWFTNQNDLHNDIWYQAPTLGDLGLSSVTYSYISATFDYSRRQHVILVGSPIPGCCGIVDADRCCFNQTSLWTFTDTNTTMSFTFPASSLFTGMAFHDGGMDLFVYGKIVANCVRSSSFYQDLRFGSRRMECTSTRSSNCGDLPLANTLKSSPPSRPAKRMVSIF